jgi:hypothetical protein
MTVTVAYSLRVDKDVFLPEPAPAAVPLRANGYLYGRLILAWGGTEVFVEDEFIPLVAACFLAPTQLAAGAEFGAYINRYPGEFYLVPAGDSIRLYGPSVLSVADNTPDRELTAPTADLLAALIGCGRRPVAFLHARLGGDPAYAAELANFARPGPRGCGPGRCVRAVSAAQVAVGADREGQE